ncbi:hypothetical protein NW755_006085 [Fusarium falciforme]|uniref:Uncharacterized protein n=1 Tax=Fusarium falciforme TaxID=195108 RepID=A0A9W8R9J5_9HYPO|nr:hypothetical protein NW755_006085 [Fusarium falciforme]
MEPKQTSSDVDPKSEEDMLRLNGSSVLMQFIYDTSSFSDRLVQLATIETASEPVRANDHEPTSRLPEADTTDEEKDANATGNSFYPEHLVVE